MKKYRKGLLAILFFALVLASIVWWSQHTGATGQTSAEATPPMLVTLPVPAAPPTAQAVSAPDNPDPIKGTQMPMPAPQDARPVRGNADHDVREALAQLMAANDLLHFVQTTNFVQHLVATVDNLPRQHAPIAAWPVNPMPGRFSVGDTTHPAPLGPNPISLANAARYRPFVAFVESVDTARAVALYTRLYPLFQQAYVELGYPKGHFNDRLIAVIDHLLEAPVQLTEPSVSRIEVKGAYRPLRPWVTYEFTDPTLQAMSAGQKMLLRTGALNHQRLRTKLMAVKAQLALISPTRLIDSVTR